MDEFNYNPFNEDKNDADPQNQYQQPMQNQQGQGYDPYNQQPMQGQQMQNGQQYNVPPQNGQPYQQQYNVPPQNGQYQQGQNPYGMPQGGYAAPQGYGVPYQPQPQQSTGMAVASLVLGIISICTGLFMFSFPFLFLVPIIGIILGIVFKSKKLPVGKGMSTAGIITSVIGLVIPIALLIFVIVMLVTNGAELMQYMKQVSPEQYEQLYEMYGDQFPQWFDGAVMFLTNLIMK
ncbi:MAG: DUF4190 domain-containing protein [Ruminococcus sp.]|nr:DUF4190 domain-containing protein [Ruminococcus sp.]